MSVDPKFHPKIIGRKGAVISQIRKDHDVSIQFPDKGDEEQVCVCIMANTGITLSSSSYSKSLHCLPTVSYLGPDCDIGL